MSPRSNSTGFEFDDDFGEWQKFFPTQSLNTSLFSKDSGKVYERIVYADLVRCLGLESSIEELQLEAPEEWTVAEMGSGRLHLDFIQFLARMTNAQSALEIGTFVGLSAIAIAKALPPLGRVVTIEKFDKYGEIALRNIQRNGLESQISVVLGDALEVLTNGSLDGLFDLIFVDGDKENYLEYVKRGLELLSPNGLIIVDDIFFQGDVFNETPTSAKGAGVKACLEWVSKQEFLDITVVPITNGMLLIRPQTEPKAD